MRWRWQLQSIDQDEALQQGMHLNLLLSKALISDSSGFTEEETEVQRGKKSTEGHTGRKVQWSGEGEDPNSICPYSSCNFVLPVSKSASLLSSIPLHRSGPPSHTSAPELTCSQVTAFVFFNAFHYSVFKQDIYVATGTDLHRALPCLNKQNLTSLTPRKNKVSTLSQLACFPALRLSLGNLSPSLPWKLLLIY